jgi:hypothetical protein
MRQAEWRFFIHYVFIGVFLALHRPDFSLRTCHPSPLRPVATKSPARLTFPLLLPLDISPPRDLVRPSVADLFAAAAMANPTYNNIYIYIYIYIYIFIYI